MAEKTKINKQEQLGHLPGQILLDLARNDSAQKEWRKAAVELLLDNKFPQVSHPDLRLFVMEIEAERSAKEDVKAVVESNIESELVPFSEQGPFKASVTTQTLQTDELA